MWGGSGQGLPPSGGNPRRASDDAGQHLLAAAAAASNYAAPVYPVYGSPAANALGALHMHHHHHQQQQHQQHQHQHHQQQQQHPHHHHLHHEDPMMAMHAAATMGMHHPVGAVYGQQHHSAVAAAAAAAAVEAKMEEEAAYAHQHHISNQSDDDDDDEEEDDENEAHGNYRMAALHKAAARGRGGSTASSVSDRGDESESSNADYSATMQQQPRGKPEAIAARLASATRLQEKMDELDEEKRSASDHGGSGDSASKGAKPKTPKKPAPKKKKSSTSKRKVVDQNAPSMEDPIQPISVEQYKNLETLMLQFCKVPLLAEFSRPVALLHPELMSIYSKIVKHPVDLGKICRGIRRREYNSLRDVRLEVWRLFANCVQYHSHPTNKQAVPSFLSISLHLREYFNALWQEFMLPSDLPRPSPQNGEFDSGGKPVKVKSEEILKRQMLQRSEDRKKRLTVSGLTIMTGKCMERAASNMKALLDNGGRVDGLDSESIFGEDAQDDDPDLRIVVENLTKLLDKLNALVASQDEYGIDEFDKDLKKCYTDEVLEHNPALRNQIANRLNRFLGKLVVPIHEANCRGVTQSSIWGCMAAAVWARESSKKPLWPALVLGIMAPDDQKEDWHLALTQRNEARLPDKLRTQLTTGKRKADQAIKRQAQGQMEPQSFFLVEFLGTHEFIWVKENDIVENFDPSDDPNQLLANKKKRLTGRNANIIGSKTYASAMEEGKWALEEFELQLQDCCGGALEDDEEAEEMNYSYAVLCQSDEEAEEEQIKADRMSMSMLDIDECNELLSTEGLLDFSAMARKNAKKRAQDMKRQQQDAVKKQKADKLKKSRAESSKKRMAAKSKEKEAKKEQRDLERRRKKRARDRERVLKTTVKKKEEEPLKTASGRRNMIIEKRARAKAVVEGYLHRAATKDYKSLAFGGVMAIPAANVEPTGILSMALAFRAAAGEIAMPDESGQLDPTKPWLAINVEAEKNESKRINALEKQIEILEEEITKVKTNTERRKRIRGEVQNDLRRIVRKVKREDTASRENPLKKKQKKTATPDKAASSSKAAVPSEIIKHEADTTVVASTPMKKEPEDVKSPLDRLLEAAQAKEETDNNEAEAEASDSNDEDDDDGNNNDENADSDDPDNMDVDES